MSHLTGPWRAVACCLEGGYFLRRTRRHGSVPKLPAGPSDSESCPPPFRPAPAEWPPDAGFGMLPRSRICGERPLLPHRTALLAVSEAVMA
jgi:hypothetical protein